VDALVDRVRDGQEVEGVVEGDHPRRPHAGLPGRRDRHRLLARRGDEGGMVARDAEDEVVTEG
jgi:hypothetical protein